MQSSCLSTKLNTVYILYPLKQCFVLAVVPKFETET